MSHNPAFGTPKAIGETIMDHDSIVEELHRHREELFRECDNNPETLVRYLQERERNSGRQVQSPPSPDATAGKRTRFARR